MTDKKINRWQDTITPRDKAPQPWTVKSGGSWDMLDIQPIPDEMLAELARDYHRLGTPWNCRSLPLSPNDREYMYLLYYSMQGLVARMRAAEKRADELEQASRATPADQEPVTTVPLILTEQMRGAVKAWVQRHPVTGAGYYAQELWDDVLSATPQAPQSDAQSVRDADPIRALIAAHTDLLEQNAYAYFKLAYTRYTGWMAWLCSNSRDDDPNRKILAKGQGESPESACTDALKSAPPQKPVSEDL